MTLPTNVVDAVRLTRGGHEKGNKGRVADDASPQRERPFVVEQRALQHDGHSEQHEEVDEPAEPLGAHALMRVERQCEHVAEAGHLTVGLLVERRAVALRRDGEAPIGARLQHQPLSDCLETVRNQINFQIRFHTWKTMSLAVRKCSEYQKSPCKDCYPSAWYRRPWSCSVIRPDFKIF